MNTYSSMGEAEGAAMAHNARMAADLQSAISRRSDAEVLCRCGHSKAQHQDATGLGGAQCKACPGDDERSWRHAFTAETASEECPR